MDVKQTIADRLAEARRRTEALLAPLDDDAVMAQHDPLQSPPVWDYGHIAVFEELWLVHRISGVEPTDTELMRRYDAAETPRRDRGSLPLLRRDEVTAYRDRVDGRALELLAETDLDGDDPLLRGGFVHEMIIEHEHQHTETLLQTLQLVAGGYRPQLPVPPPGRPVGADMVDVPGGRYPIGSSGHLPYDNERGVHEVELAPFRIQRFPVSCGQYLEFVADGGYRRPELWGEAGRAWLAESGASAPKHWRHEDGGWITDRFGHTVVVRPDLPVMHVCWHEADAYARWAGLRLPTEFEWEVAARWDPASRRMLVHPWGDGPATAEHANLDQRLFGCAPVGAYPAGASPLGCEQMIGDVWEWTSSDFLAYPGFEAFPYAEYSEVFFGGDYKVLRGASWAARPSLARAAFRNWDHPIRRQIFSGFRCAAGGAA
ncbi:MAG TPA: ergothioneine biosynthesis protein EgtB [Candidatus Dormibacteraeota bacterium]|jgi:iron(II)-dependent oxidoreductase|nr:ergothioneine biosynthesis protein EgtB [Candidatus Dormibacteraeota bacterium]